MATDQQEVEWQFDVADADLNRVEQWLLSQSTSGDIAISPDATQNHGDTYLDTNDWRFYRAGYALRIRRNGQDVEATLKALTDAQTGPRERRELTEDIEGSGSRSTPTELLRHAQGAVGQRVRAIAGPTARLLTLFEAHTKRSTLNLRVGDAPAGEIALDETTIPAGTRAKQLQLCRVEVEIKGDPTKEVKAFVKQMHKACDLKRAKTSKFEAGILARELKPITELDFGPTEIDKSSSVGEVAIAALRQSYADMWAHEPGARLGDNTGEIHDMRVAVRRQRAAMGLFKDYLPEQVASIRDELGWIGDALGKVRDLDVQIEHVNAWREDADAHPSTVPGAERGGQQEVVAILMEQRHAAHAALLAVFNSRRYERFNTNITALLRNPPQGPDTAQAPITDSAPDLITRHYRKMRKLGDKLKPESPPVDYHRVRIKCKHLRYGIEFVADLYGKPAKAMLERAIELQDILGLYHDAQVAMELFHNLSSDPNPEDAASPEVVFALGETAERYEQLAAEMKAKFPKVYARLKGKPWRRLKNALEAKARAQ